MNELQKKAVDELVKDDHRAFATLKPDIGDSLRLTFEGEEYIVYSDGAVQLPLPFNINDNKH